MDKLIYKDYAAWKLENQQILEKFQENNNVIYEKLEPVYIVLNHIYDMVVEGEELDEDFGIIFEVGFNYLNSQFEVIKIYFESLFQKNCDDFFDFGELILYLMYIYDVRTDLESNDYDSDIEVLNECERIIENMIMERRKDYTYASNLVNEALKSVFSIIEYEYVSIVDIFVEIAESLGIYIYEDNELVIGREI